MTTTFIKKITNGTWLEFCEELHEQDDGYLEIRGSENIILDDEGLTWASYNPDTQEVSFLFQGIWDTYINLDPSLRSFFN